MSKESPKHKRLYNKSRDSFAEWNGHAYEDKSVPGAYFYGLEKAANNGYFPEEKDFFGIMSKREWIQGCERFFGGKQK
jgi:hypothetical protein